LKNLLNQQKKILLPETLSFEKILTKLCFFDLEIGNNVILSLNNNLLNIPIRNIQPEELSQYIFTKEEISKKGILSTRQTKSSLHTKTIECFKKKITIYTKSKRIQSN